MEKNAHLFCDDYSMHCSCKGESLVTLKVINQLTNIIVFLIN